MLNIKEFEEKKSQTLVDVLQYLIDHGEDGAKCKDGEINFPIVGTDGNDGWLVVKFVVPRGDRDGNEYDGYSEREAYQMTLQKRADRAAEKAKKIAKDAEKRAKEKEEKAE